jgi:hypothetical protein
MSLLFYFNSEQGFVIYAHYLCNSHQVKLCLWWMKQNVCAEWTIVSVLNEANCWMKHTVCAALWHYKNEAHSLVPYWCIIHQWGIVLTVCPVFCLHKQAYDCISVVYSVCPLFNLSRIHRSKLILHTTKIIIQSSIEEVQKASIWHQLSTISAAFYQEYRATNDSN